MDLIAQAVEIGPRGAFYEVTDGAGKHVMWTACHAYQIEGAWVAKVGAGVWHCKRGDHEIHATGPGGVRYLKKINTFEIQNVPGHTGLLFPHVGNEPQKESDGCHLCGAALGFVNNNRAVIISGPTVEAFAKRMAGVDEFTLTIKDIA